MSLGIARIGIQPLNKTFHHGSQITGRIGPVRLWLHFISGAVEIEAAVKLVDPLSVVLVPQKTPLGQQVRAV